MNFVFRVVKQYCFSPRGNKFHIFKLPCNFLFIIYTRVFAICLFNFSLPAEMFSGTAVAWRQEFLEVLSFRPQ